jgi:hypothetical protein
MTIYHTYAPTGDDTGSHPHRLARHLLQALFQFTYSASRAPAMPTPLAVFCSVEGSSLGSASFPPHYTLAIPTHIITTGLDWTLQVNATSNPTWSLPCIQQQLRHRTTIGRVARSLSHHTSAVAPVCLRTCLAYLQCGNAPSPLTRRGCCRSQLTTPVVHTSDRISLLPKCRPVRSRHLFLHLRRADGRSCLGPVLCLTETTSNLNPILLFPRFVNTAYPDLSLQHSSRAWPHANATTYTLDFP